MDPKPKPDPPTTQALRLETRGLILIALIILAVYLTRYFRLVHWITQ